MGSADNADGMGSFMQRISLAVPHWLASVTGLSVRARGTGIFVQNP